MTTVGAGQVNDEPQLAGGIVHVLTFKGTFLRFVGPHDAFVHVEEAIRRSEHCNHPPAGSFGNL